MAPQDQYDDRDDDQRGGLRGSEKADHRSKSSFFRLADGPESFLYLPRKQKQHGSILDRLLELHRKFFTGVFTFVPPIGTFFNKFLIAIGFIAFFTWMWYQNKYKSAPEQMD